MVDERELKTKGEELAELAVKSELGAAQLRDVYYMSKTKSLPFVEAFIQHQINRVSGRAAWEMMLDLLKDSGEDKERFSRILMYANMLRDFKERQVARLAAEEIARKICQQQGCDFVGLDLTVERREMEFVVKVGGFRGDPKSLAIPIKQEIINRHPSFQVYVMIDQTDRR